MNTLKLKFKLTNDKEKTVNIKNAKPSSTLDDIKALGNYIAQNEILNYSGNKVKAFIGAVMVDTTETNIEP